MPSRFWASRYDVTSCGCWPLASSRRVRSSMPSESRFQISQPAVSQHLKVLREAGLVSVRAEGTRRIYAVSPAPLREIDDWLQAFRSLWEPALDALETEIARGKRQRRLDGTAPPSEERKASA